MMHLHALVEPHRHAVSEEIRHEIEVRAINRGSPGIIRTTIARMLVLTGARLHGRTPAVFGDRVVILDPCQDRDLRLAA